MEQNQKPEWQKALDNYLAYLNQNEKSELTEEKVKDISDAMHSLVMLAMADGVKTGREQYEEDQRELDLEIKAKEEQQFKVPGYSYIAYLLNRPMYKFSFAEAFMFILIFGGAAVMLYLAFFYSYS